MVVRSDLYNISWMKRCHQLPKPSYCDKVPHPDTIMGKCESDICDLDELILCEHQLSAVVCAEDRLSFLFS